MPTPKQKRPKRKPIPRPRQRTSDPILEPGLAAATRRSQAPFKWPKMKPIPKREHKGLTAKAAPLSAARKRKKLRKK